MNETSPTSILKRKKRSSKSVVLALACGLASPATGSARRLLSASFARHRCRAVRLQVAPFSSSTASNTPYQRCAAQSRPISLESAAPRSLAGYRRHREGGIQIYPGKPGARRRVTSLSVARATCRLALAAAGSCATCVRPRSARWLQAGQVAPRRRYINLIRETGRAKARYKSNRGTRHVSFTARTAAPREGALQI